MIPEILNYSILQIEIPSKLPLEDFVSYDEDAESFTIYEQRDLSLIDQKVSLLFLV